MKKGSFMRPLVAFLSIFAACIFAAPASAQFGDCSSPTYVQSFDPRLTDRTCEEIARFQIRFDGREVPMRVVKLAGTGSESGATVVHNVDALATRVGLQLAAMGDLDIDPVTVLFTNIERIDPDGPVHGAATGLRGPECRVTFYKLDEPISQQEFVFTYAHELFHCVQHKTFRARSMVAAAIWWLEGSAEYFAHLAQPDSSYGDDYISAFDTTSLRKRLVDMAYENVVFFFWLDQMGGPGRVRNFLASMPETSGMDAQLDALRRSIPMDAWTQFGETYANGEVERPNGARVPKPEYGDSQVAYAGGESHRFETDAYMLNRYGVVFREGMTYDLNMTVEDDASIRLRMQPDGGGWDDPPATVNACSEDKGYLLLALSTEGPAAATLTAEATEILDRRACCLVGDWIPTEDSILAEAALMNAMGGPAASAMRANFVCSPAGGGWVLSFFGAGAGQVAWEGFTNRCVITGPKGDGVQTMTRTGTTTFNWTVTDRGAGRAEYTGNSVQYTYDVNGLFSRTFNDAGPSTSANGFAYQCTDTDLTIKGIYGINAEEATYTRGAVSIRRP